MFIVTIKLEGALPPYYLYSIIIKKPKIKSYVIIQFNFKRFWVYYW